MELRNPPGIPERHRGHSQLIHEIEVPLTDEDLGATNVPGNRVPSSRVDPTNQGDGSHSVPMERDDLGSLTCSQTLVKRKQDPTNQGDGSHSVTTNVDFTEPQLALVKRHRALQVGLSRPLPVDCCDLPGCTCKSTRAGNPISGLLLSGDNIPGHYKAPLVCTELPQDLDEMLQRDGHVALRMPKRVFQLRGHIACNVSHPQPNG